MSQRVGRGLAGPMTGSAEPIIHSVSSRGAAAMTGRQKPVATLRGHW